MNRATGAESVEEVVLPQTVWRSFLVRPEVREIDVDEEYSSSASFWRDVLDPRKSVAERVVRLRGFYVSEWVPRNPGLYHTRRGQNARDQAELHVLQRGGEVPPRKNRTRTKGGRYRPPGKTERFRVQTAAQSPALGTIYTPQGKFTMLQGGVGCVRLRPFELNEGDLAWFMSASSSGAPDEGIPLLIRKARYQQIIDEIKTVGHKACTVVGRTKFIPKDFTDLYSRQYRIQRLYVEVEHLEPHVPLHALSSEVSVATSFLSEYEGHPSIYASYVTFDPGRQGAKQSATEWMHEEYIKGLYKGIVLTDFDQQETEIADALFSLDHVLTTPDLAAKIAELAKLYGYFDWEMLERAVFNFNTIKESLIVNSVVKGPNNKVIITTGEESQATIVDSSHGGGAITMNSPGNQQPQPTPQERYRHVYTLLAFATGVLFLIALLAISLIWPTPTPPQLRVQVSILALAAAGFATVISGLIDVTAKIGKQLAIGATGALAVLVLFYFWNPAVMQ